MVLQIHGSRMKTRSVLCFLQVELPRISVLRHWKSVHPFLSYQEHIMKKKYWFAAGLLSILLTSCGTAPMSFTRYYSPADGSGIEIASYDDSGSFTNTYRDTFLAQLMQRYPDAKAPADAEKTGAYFFFVKDYNSGFGFSTGDYANRAAFFLLEMPENYAKPQAMLIRQLMISDDVEAMKTVYEDIKKKNSVLDENIYEGDNNAVPAFFTEYILNEKGSRVRHGLTRSCYPNGMIKSEVFYRNGVKEGVERKYNEHIIPGM